MAKSRSEKENILLEVSLIDFSQLKLGNPLGSGGFGQVFKGKYLRHKVAIKQMYLKTTSEGFEKEFKNEVSIMNRCRHPSLVHLYGVSIHDNNFYLIMEYLPKKSLYKLLSSDIPISWSTRINYCYDIAAGLSYLHSANIVDRDLKSMNILLDKQNKAKISDFGLSVIKIATQTSSFIQTPSDKKIGSVRWNAPELFQLDSNESLKSDIWSFGMLLYEIASRKIPFAHVTDDMRVIYFITSGAKQTIPTECPSIFAKVIEDCWNMKPEERPTASELFSRFIPNDSEEEEVTPASGQIDSSNFNISDIPTYALVKLRDEMKRRIDTENKWDEANKKIEKYLEDLRNWKKTVISQLEIQRAKNYDHLMEIQV